MIFLRYFKFFCYVSFVAGFRFFRQENPSKFVKILWTGFGWFSDVVLFNYVCRITARLLFVQMTTAQILETIPTFFYVGQIFLKSAMIRINSKRIDRYFLEMEGYLTIMKEDRHFRKIWAKNFTMPNKICKRLFYIQVIGLGISFVPSLYTIIVRPEAPVIRFAAVYLFGNYFGFKVFYLILDVIQSGFCVVKSSAIESLYLTCVVLHISQYEYLTSWLRKINSDSSRDNYELRSWSKRHQDFLRLSKNFKNWTEPLLLIIYVYNLINIATMAMFVTANGDMTQGQKILGAIVVSVTFIYFGLACIQTDVLEQLHDSIPNETYIPRTIWSKSRKEFAFMTSLRSFRKFRLTAMGLFTLSCSSFKELVATTGTFLIALWQIRQRVIRQE